MSPDALATFPDRFTLSFVCDFPHAIDRVWRALTDPEEVGAWFTRMTVDPRIGGAYGFQGERWGRILELAPPRLATFGKDDLPMFRGQPCRAGENYFRYELEQVDGGTRLLFTERWQPGLDYRDLLRRRFGEDGDDLPGGPDSPFHPGTVAGWHDALSALRVLLDSSGASTSEVRRKIDADLTSYAELIAIYRPHIKATLPPV